MRWIYNIVAFLLMLSFYGCDNDIENQNVGEPGDFKIMISAPQSPDVRSSDGVTIPQSVDEQLKDGWAIKDIAVFFCMKGVVHAYRSLSVDTSNGAPAATSIVFDLSASDGSWAKTTPDNVTIADGSKHGINVFNPETGTYNVYAIANYGGSGTEIESLINNVNSTIDNNRDFKENPTSKENIKTALNNAINGLLNAKINTEAPSYLCDASKNMILSLSDEIMISAGVNAEKSTLRRTCSRIRIVVRNENTQYDMVVKDLSLGNITQTSIPLFDSDTRLDVNAAPLLTSEMAKHKFQATTLKKNGSKEDQNKLDEAVVFDGYILENKSDAGYKFSLQVKVNTGTREETVSNYQEGNGVDYIYSGYGDIFLIKVNGTNELLYNSGNFVSVEPYVSLNDVGEIANNYLWTFNNLVNSYANPAYHMISCDDGKKAEGITVMMATENTKQLTMGNGHIYRNGDIGYQSWYTLYTYFYIGKDGKWYDTGSNSGGWGYDPGDLPDASFSFVPVTITQSTKQVDDVTRRRSIPFTKMVNEKAYNVKEIKRNQFYHVFINVRYNDKLGTIEYDVEPWKNVTGSVEFD